MPYWLQSGVVKLVDLFFEYLPQQVPSQKALVACKIIAHRGEHDNFEVMENTFAAFDLARDNNVWGVECDIRWTKDLVPIISHDPDGLRVFGDPARIDKLTVEELGDRLPGIPTLAEMVERYGQDLHLMIEIKDEHYPDPAAQKEKLQKVLSPLTAGTDYHFLALDTKLFEQVDFLSPELHFPVSEINFSKLSHESITLGLGGLTGHFLLLNDDLKALHESAGQRIGTGFIASKYCLFRELNRGIEWIFSNDAVKIQKARDKYLIH